MEPQNEMTLWALLLGNSHRLSEIFIACVLPFGQNGGVCLNLGLMQCSVLALHSGQEKELQKCGWQRLMEEAWSPLW